MNKFTGIIPFYYNNGNIKTTYNLINGKIISKTLHNKHGIKYSRHKYDNNYNINDILVFDKNKHIVYEKYYNNDNNVIEILNFNNPIIKCKLINNNLTGVCTIPKLDYNNYFNYHINALITNINNKQNKIYSNVIDLINSNLKFKIKYYFNCNFENNIIHGSNTIFEIIDNDVLIICKNNYKNGLIHGKYEEFYDNNKHKIICNYNNGKLDGEYKEFYDNSKQKYLYCFNNGHIIKNKTFYFDK